MTETDRVSPERLNELIAYYGPRVRKSGARHGRNKDSIRGDTYDYLRELYDARAELAALRAENERLKAADDLFLDTLPLRDQLLAAHTALIHAAHEYRKRDNFDSAQCCSTAALHVRSLISSEVIRNAALAPQEPTTS